METIKKMYDALDLTKVDPEVREELEGIREETEDFTDSDIVEMNRESLMDLLQIANQQIENAQQISVKKVETEAPKADAEVPKVKASKVKVIKIKKTSEKKEEKEAKGKEGKQGKEGKIIKLEAQEVTIEKNDLLDPCEEIITERLRLAKDAKLKEHKKKLTAELKIKYEASELDQEKYEQKIMEIEELSYAKAFTKEKSITEAVADHLLSIFNRVITANSTQIRKSSKIALDKKVEQLKKNCKEVLDHFTGKSFPDILELFLGNKSEKFIDDFKKKAEKSSETQIIKLDKYIKYQQKQSA